MSVRVGDTVYWFQSMQTNARAWPAVVLAIHSGNTVDVNVHQPNRLMHKQTVFHRTEPQLKRWSPQDLELSGCWTTIREHDALIAEMKAKQEAAAAEHQKMLREQEAARQEGATNPAVEPPGQPDPSQAGKGKKPVAA